jgi:ferritin-like protein
MSDYHENLSSLDEKTLNIARALHSLKEEVEAVNWYNQRVAASQDEALRGVMAHNRDEEIEHACMAIEWLRRNMEGWDENLKTYLFTEADITSLEEGEGEEEQAGSGDLGIGKPKEEA